jgi:Asp-tRNA(Asn)/Glu-tRNA(Gln) amidotransferase C subunit
MLKRATSRAARLRQQAERCMQIARLMSKRQQAKALRKQAEEIFAHAQELEKAETKTA